RQLHGPGADAQGGRSGRTDRQCVTGNHSARERNPGLAAHGRDVPEGVTNTMMRSMFDGVAGLRAHQTMMDVVGNNIANVNTAGYKASAVTFQEALTQVMRGPSSNLNPVQLGLGVKVGAVDPIFTQGATQVTGRPTDLAIQGDGFFVVQQGSSQLYTRAGSFSFDSTGNLVSTSGATLAPATVTFGTDGKIATGSTLAVSGYTPPGANPMAFNVDLAGASPIVQFGGASTIQIISQDGMPIGSLQGVKISNDGTISGQFSN